MYVGHILAMMDRLFLQMIDLLIIRFLFIFKNFFSRQVLSRSVSSEPTNDADERRFRGWVAPTLQDRRLCERLAFRRRHRDDDEHSQVFSPFIFDIILLLFKRLCRRYQNFEF